jgi:hypothetical protein
VHEKILLSPAVALVASEVSRMINTLQEFNKTILDGESRIPEDTLYSLKNNIEICRMDCKRHMTNPDCDVNANKIFEALYAGLGASTSSIEQIIEQNDAIINTTFSTFDFDDYEKWYSSFKLQ